MLIFYSYPLKKKFLNCSYLGEAIGQNPGYLKLRKIRAAQNISRTVMKTHCVIQRVKI